MSSSRAKRLRENQEDVASTDRISLLPDDLLVQILLLVSTKDAVAATVLSKRWLSVWTMVPKLEYIDRINRHSSPNIRSFCSFFNKSMELHKTPILETLRIQTYNDSIDTRNLIANAVDRSVRVLEFNLFSSSKIAQLPQSLYTCETLVKLTLSYGFHVDVPSSAYLPSLKKLLLVLVKYKNEDSLVRLLSSCCILARSTIYLNVADSWKRNFRIKNVLLPIRVLCRSHDKFLKSLSFVTSLSLRVKGLKFSGITFSQLQRVKLRIISDYWGSLLLQILNNSPTLRFLHINCKNDIYSLRWTPPRFIPTCMSSHLEFFEWKNYRGERGEKDLMIYIFANSECLKIAKINVTRKMQKELESMPRVSPMSQLLFT